MVGLKTKTDGRNVSDNIFGFRYSALDQKAQNSLHKSMIEVE